jgi:hypothetical protein
MNTVRMDIRVDVSLKKALQQLAHHESKKRGEEITLTDVVTQILQRALDQEYEASADEVLGRRLERAIAKQMTQAADRIAPLLSRAAIEANATRRAVMGEIHLERGLDYARSLARATYRDAVEDLRNQSDLIDGWLEERERGHAGQNRRKS